MNLINKVFKTAQKQEIKKHLLIAQNIGVDTWEEEKAVATKMMHIDIKVITKILEIVTDYVMNSESINIPEVMRVFAFVDNVLNKHIKENVLETIRHRRKKGNAEIAFGDEEFLEPLGLTHEDAEKEIQEFLKFMAEKITDEDVDVGEFIHKCGEYIESNPLLKSIAEDSDVSVDFI